MGRLIQREKQKIFYKSVLPFFSFGCPTQWRIALGRCDRCNWASTHSPRELDFSGPLPSLVDFAVIYRVYIRLYSALEGR